MNEMHNEWNKKKSIMRKGIGSLDFWKMILTFGVCSSVDNRKTLEYESDNDDNKFTFRKMLETNPEAWHGLEGYDEFANSKCVEWNPASYTLTLRNIKVYGEWYAYYIEEDVFRCINLDSNIKHIIMEDSVSLPGNYIPSYAFYACHYLESFVMPSTVKTIGGKSKHDGDDDMYNPDYYGAFYDCSALTSVTIPKGVTSIGKWVFGYCKALTSITIPEGVTSIGQDAFFKCEALTSITIPKNCTINDPLGEDTQGWDNMDALKYIITTDYVVRKQGDIIFRSMVNNSSSLSFDDDITGADKNVYHIFTADYNTNTVKYAQHTDPIPALISTPGTIAPYVSNPDYLTDPDNNLYPKIPYTFILKEKSSTASSTSAVKIIRHAPISAQ